MKVAVASITNANAGEVLLEGLASIANGDFEVDLAAVTEVDTAAIALLLEWQRQAAARGGRLVFSSVPADVDSLARLYGVERLLALDGQRAA